MFNIILLILITTSNLSIANQSKINLFANYLAGLIDEDQEHSKQIKKLWMNYQAKNLDSLSNWSKDELDHSECQVFYPFSGPDVVHITKIFPKCNRFIMIGLEPTGRIDNLTDQAIDLSRLRQGLYSLLNKSFFVTKEMWSDFSLQANGVMVPMITLLKLMNYDIIELESFYLTKNGDLLEKNSNDETNGIRLIIRDPKLNYDQTIIYLRKSLSGPMPVINSLISDNYLITYLKAAQYALFDQNFKSIREFILTHSQMILQDDSGIPFKYFNNKNWHKTLYGQYQGPYGNDFSSYWQADLSKYYLNNKARLLPFSLGYGYQRISSNLLKACKNN